MVDCCGNEGEGRATNDGEDGRQALPTVEANGPVACTLDPVALRSRKDRWTRFVAESGLDRERGDGVLRVRFRDDPANRAELGELVRLERGCCAHLRWGAGPSRDGLFLTVMGDPDELDALPVLGRLPLSGAGSSR